jgi:Probable lipoprotein LpqN
MSFGGLIPVRSPLDRLLTRLGAYCLRLSAHRVGLIKHGNDDAQLFENFKQLDTSAANFNDFPSSMIQGTARGCTAVTGSSSPPDRRPPTSDTWFS